MNKQDLQSRLNSNPLEYRDILTIPQNINFGLEIELENIKYNEVYKLIKNNFGPNWSVKKDKSLPQNKSAEIVTPVFQNKKETWITLKKLGGLLQKLNPTYSHSSFQINYDGFLLPTNEDKVRFLKLYAMYEDIVYRFSKGEDKEYRESLEEFASPIIYVLKSDLKYGNDLFTIFFSNNKRYGVTYKTETDLIEFRTPNGTNNPILMQNYITFFYYLIKLSTSNKINIEELDNYLNRFMKNYLLESYERLRIEKALTLSEQLYEDEQDKTYFLHQYIGKNK